MPMKVTEYHKTWLELTESKFFGLYKVRHFLVKTSGLWMVASFDSMDEAPTNEMLKVIADYEARNYSNL